MSTLAADGHRVLFVENTGVRGPTLGDLPRAAQAHPQLVARDQAVPRRAAEPVRLLAAAAAVPVLAAWRAGSTGYFMFRAIRRWMRHHRLPSRPIVWSFLPTPLALDADRRISIRALTIYYCIDDLARSSPEARRIVASEEKLFRRADLVFVTSEKLRQRAAGIRQRRPPVSLRCQLRALRARRNRRRGDAGATSPSLPRPIVGYVGGLHQWVDQDLIVEIARRMPTSRSPSSGPSSPTCRC